MPEYVTSLLDRNLVGRKLYMILTEHPECIQLATLLDSDDAVVDIRLHVHIGQQAFQEGKPSCLANVGLDRDVSWFRIRIFPATNGEVSSLFKFSSEVQPVYG